jgi:chemotaxis protein histidine kinase CheA
MASLEEDVRAGTARIQAILDNVGSGLLLVGWDRKVAPGWSKSCAAILGNVNPTGMVLSEALGLVGRDAADFDLGIEQILDDVLPEELTVAQARDRVSVGARTVGLTYGVVRKDGAVDAVLVTMTDVTAQMVAERAARLGTALLEIRKRLPLFRMFVEDSRRLLDDGKLASEVGDDAAVRRCVHTLKGNASVHDLVDVVRVAHEVESCEVIGVEGLNAVEASLEAFLAEHRDVIGADELDESSDEIRIVEADLRALIVRAGGNPERVADSIRARHFVPAGTLVAALESSAQRVATRLQKLVSVVISGSQVPVDPRRLSSVIGNLPHLVRNAIDHGLELPDERGGKDPTGRLELAFEDLPNAWKISVRDDGRGIDPRRVAAAAAAKGLSARPTSVEEAVEVLCMPGFSTAECVSDISGRGVGLPAVKQALADLGGQLVVRSTPGSGTAVEMLCPKAA